MANATHEQFKRTDDVCKLLARVGKSIDQDPAKALEELARANVNSPWIANAIGVAQLRLGNHETAVEVLRRLVLGAGGIVLRDDVPPVFHTNYATALLVGQNVSGCLIVVSQLKPESHPAVERIKQAIERWQASMTLWQRFKYRVGGTTFPIQLDFPPGDLE
jgi:hypothetical protein